MSNPLPVSNPLLEQLKLWPGSGRGGRHGFRGLRKTTLFETDQISGFYIAEMLHYIRTQCNFYSWVPIVMILFAGACYKSPCQIFIFIFLKIV
jgi:hypothetical protein